MQAPQVGQYKTTKKASKINSIVSVCKEVVQFNRGKKTGSYPVYCDLDISDMGKAYFNHVLEENYKDFQTLGNLLIKM